MDDIRLLQLSMIVMWLDFLILILYVVFLQKRVKELERRESALNQEFIKWGTNLASAQLKTTEPPKLIVEEETAFQRYQRGNSG